MKGTLIFSRPNNMRLLILLLMLIIGSCESQTEKSSINQSMPFTEADILTELDETFLAYANPFQQQNGLTYSFFLDLEHGYFETAGSQIHLFADSSRWAIVFEKSGYANRATAAQLELVYVGNCINYPIEEHEGRTTTANSIYINLITSEEYERIEDKDTASLADRKGSPSL